MTTGGYHGFEIFEGSTDLVKCLYCTGILRDAMELPCGHLICEVCLQRICQERYIDVNDLILFIWFLFFIFFSSKSKLCAK